jgi:hypothetical protein
MNELLEVLDNDDLLNIYLENVKLNDFRSDVRKLSQLQAKIAAIVSDMKNCQPSLYAVYWSEYINKLLQLSGEQ